MPSADAQEPKTASHFKELVSFRLNMLASHWSRLAAESNQRDFELDPREWRILGMLGANAPMSLQGLAREVNIDKSLASRAVAGLVERQLVLRETGRDDAREVALRLTQAGKRVHKGLMRAAQERDDAFIACLTPQEHAVLTSAIRRLETEARRHAALAAAEATEAEG